MKVGLPLCKAVFGGGGSQLLEGVVTCGAGDLYMHLGGGGGMPK